MNSLDEPEVVAQIGKDALTDVFALGYWLYGATPNSYRFAPSVIVRSEAELFGISAPRFACRAAFDDGSFINLRRLEHLCSKLEAAHPGLSPDRIRASLYEPRGASWGDALLKLPERFAKTHIALRCKLGRAYGESDASYGTPFLRHIRLCGGMCSQATCFMVSALYESVVHAIHGLAEITVWTANGEPVVPLQGMSLPAMQQYLREQELSSHFESVPAVADSNAVVGSVLRSYLMSSVPVILPVASTQWSETLNAMPAEDEPFIAELDEVGQALHVVLLVGCHTSDPQRYLVNDAATCPFISMDLGTLLKCNSSPLSTEGLVLSVLPPDVTLPLLGFKTAQGLWWRRRAISYSISTIGSFTCESLARAVPGFRLIDSNPGGWNTIQAKLKKQLDKSKLSEADGFDGIFRGFIDGMLGAGWKWPQLKQGLRWIWVEWAHNNDTRSVFFWSAQPTRISPSTPALEWLIAGFVKEPGQPWTQVYP